jgi:anti-sigma regulatory factor (Ser/Thr protein kinase)
MTKSEPFSEAHLVLQNQLAGLETITQFLDDLAMQWDLPATTTMTLNLVLEEAFTNVVQYAYADDLPHEIGLRFMKQGNTIAIELSDDGTPYDPTQKEDPDTTLSASERAIGGLGIFLIRQMMDSVHYERKDGKNHLRMEKNI